MGPTSHLHASASFHFNIILLQCLTKWSLPLYSNIQRQITRFIKMTDMSVRTERRTYVKCSILQTGTCNSNVIKFAET